MFPAANLIKYSVLTLHNKAVTHKTKIFIKKIKASNANILNSFPPYLSYAFISMASKISPLLFPILLLIISSGIIKKFRGSHDCFINDINPPLYEPYTIQELKIC
jgi:hypothetical protein